MFVEATGVWGLFVATIYLAHPDSGNIQHLQVLREIVLFDA